MTYKPHDRKRVGNAELLGLSVGFVLLWNSGFIGAEFGLPHSGPFTLLWWRYLALTLILLPVVLLRRESFAVPRRQIGRIALVGVLSHAVWLSCVLLALDRGVPAGIVALVVSLQPLLTGVLSGAVTGERTSMRQWIGLALGFAGVAVAVGVRLSVGSEISAFAYLIPFGSAAAITAASLIQRRSELVADGRAVPLRFQLLVQCAATTAVVAVPALLLESLRTSWVSTYIVTMLWLILAVSLGAYALMWLLLAKTSATRVASLFYLGPPVTMLMAWAAFGDTLIASDIAGLAVAASGVAVVSRAKAPS